MVEEVGAEMGTLLAAAKGCGGVCVHSGKLYRAGSYMDAEAELGSSPEACRVRQPSQGCFMTRRG